MRAKRATATFIEQLAAWAGDGGPGFFQDFVAPGPDTLRGELDDAARLATRGLVSLHEWMSRVYAPAIEALYRGGPGIGAWRSVGAQTGAIRVGHDSADGICRVVASKSHLNAETQAFIDRLSPVSLVQAGSSLKFCRVAEGQADIYPRLAPTCEWDTAAAQAILEGAGGAVLDLQGQPLRYGKPDVLNPSFIATRDAALIPV